MWRGEGRIFGTQLWEAPRHPLHNCVSAGSSRHATLWPSADAALRPTQRDDDRRRAFLQLRRWLAPCETPYFATRGRGDMRGVPNRSCTQSHPGGGAGLCSRRGAVCIILCTTWLCGAMTACHHLRGGILGRRLWPPHVADTPVGEIRGYAQRQPPTGVGKYLAFGPHLHYGGVAAMASQARCSVFT